MFLLANTKNEKTDIFSYAVAGLFCLSITLGFLVRNVQGICFFMLAIIGLVSMISTGMRERGSVSGFLKEYRWLCLSMLALILAVFSSELVNRNFYMRDYDAVMRFLFFPFILWCFVRMKGTLVTRLPLSFIAICIPAFILAFVATNGGAIRSREYLSMASFIIFSCLTTIMAFMLTVFLLSEFRRQNRYLNLLIGIAIICGFSVSFLYQVRGAWLGYPWFVALCFYGYRRNRPTGNIKKIAAITTLAIILLGAVLYNTSAYDRLQQGISDIQRFSHNPDTSMGIRFQHWHGSLIAFSSSPVFGITLSRMPDFFRDLHNKGVVSHRAAKDTKHTHSEILFTMASRGTVGLLALLATWLVPATWFLKKMRNRTAAYSVSPSLMGLGLVGAYFFFTLVDVLFFWQRSVMFYVLVLAFLVAYEKHVNSEK